MNTLRTCRFTDLGIMDFSQAHVLQLKILDRRISGKDAIDSFLLLEHPPVFTLGRGAKQTHLKVSPDFLAEAGMNIVSIERGGDITYHGPGQLLLYTIIHLRTAGIGVDDFVWKLEEIMIRTSDHFGVSASRDHRNRGVWSSGKKLGFIGLAVRHGISFHGMALNVDLSLRPFSWMNPCGLEGIEVTSLSVEAGRRLSMEAVKTEIRHHLEEIFHISLQCVTYRQTEENLPSNPP